MRVIDLIGHSHPNIDASISREVAKYGPGFAAHAHYCGIMMPGKDAAAWLARPVFFYRPGTEAAWEKMAKEVLLWQATLIPTFTKSTGNAETLPMRRVMRG